ncbi:MAG: SPOR domain-containing protein [Spirochaetota bacterium]|mgnify:CR=1 FL=1
MSDYQNPPPPPEDFERHIVEHDMYVVNLSKGRIFLLVITSLLVVGLAFAGGWYFAIKNGGQTFVSFMPRQETGPTNIVVSPVIPRAKEETVHAIDTVKPDEDTKKSILDELAAADTASRKKLEADLDAPAKKAAVKKTAAVEEVEKTADETPAKKTATKITTTAKKAAAETADAKKSVSGKGFYIQLAVSAEKKSAEYEGTRLKKNFPLTFVREETNKSGDPVFKIKMGRFAAKDDAAAELAKVKKTTRHKDAYIYFVE